jgi:hypothetical protein
LVAIRESIRLDSSLGRALVGILLVFAQMEREATGERTKEAINHIRKSGYHFGKVPFGKRTIPAPDHPRMKILVDDEEELAVIAQIKEWAKGGSRNHGDGEPTERQRNQAAAGGDVDQEPDLQPATEAAAHHPEGSQRATVQRCGDSGANPRATRQRSHARQIASILNEQGWIPLKGRQFTERNVQGLLRSSDAAKLLSPRRYLEMMLTRMERAHEKECPGEPFEKPPLPTLAKLLEEAGYKTPRGHEHWWPAQVAQVMEGRFDGYYDRFRESPADVVSVSASNRRPRGPNTIEYKIGEIFRRRSKTRLQSGYNLREIIDHIDALRFGSQSREA